MRGTRGGPGHRMSAVLRTGAPAQPAARTAKSAPAASLRRLLHGWLLWLVKNGAGAWRRLIIPGPGEYPNVRAGRTRSGTYTLFNSREIMRNTRTERL